RGRRASPVGHDTGSCRARDGDSVIGRAAVRDDYFEAAVDALLEDRANAPLDLALLVACRHDHGDAWGHGDGIGREAVCHRRSARTWDGGGTFPEALPRASVSPVSSGYYPEEAALLTSAMPACLRPVRLGIYTDLVYRTHGGGVSTDRAFVLFLNALGERVDELVLFGRLDPTPGRAP